MQFCCTCIIQLSSDNGEISKISAWPLLSCRRNKTHTTQETPQLEVSGKRDIKRNLNRMIKKGDIVIRGKEVIPPCHFLIIRLRGV